MTSPAAGVGSPGTGAYGSPSCRRTETACHSVAVLVVSAHDEQPYIQPLLYQSALQHLLDGVFVLLCEGHDDRHAQLLANLDRIQLMLEP